MLEKILKQNEHEIHLVLDPHDGACHGQHNIVVWVQRVRAVNDVLVSVHVTYGWAGSALLPPDGTREFANALFYAMDRGEELRQQLLADG